MTTDERPAPSSEGTSSRGQRGRDRRAARKHLPVWQEAILLLGVALLLAIVIKALFVQAFWIPSVSMEPGLVKNDRILVQKWSYWGSGTPQRGDVVVFEDPDQWLSAGETVEPGAVQSVLERIGLYPSGGHLVKRVVGVAGDTITCCDRAGRIRVNGVALDEPYLKNQSRCNGPMPSQCREDWTAGPVPEGHLFVMGDHRDQSADSSYRICRPRQVGCVPGQEFVPADLVVGKVFLLVWPSDRFGRITRPEVFDRLPRPDDE